MDHRPRWFALDTTARSRYPSVVWARKRFGVVTPKQGGEPTEFEPSAGNRGAPDPGFNVSENNNSLPPASEDATPDAESRAAETALRDAQSAGDAASPIKDDETEPAPAGAARPKQTRGSTILLIAFSLFALLGAASLAARMQYHSAWRDVGDPNGYEGGASQACDVAKLADSVARSGPWGWLVDLIEPNAHVIEWRGWCAQSEAASIALALRLRVETVALDSAPCGDGIVNGRETCDDGNSVIEACAYGVPNCEVCGPTCTLVAGQAAFCGDGVVAAGSEECDPGTGDPTGRCSTLCKFNWLTCYSEYGQMPVPGDLGKVRAVSVGSSSVCALKEDGSISCWRGGDDGQPYALTAPGFSVTDIQTLGFGWDIFCGLRGNGQPKCFGFEPGSSAATENYFRPELAKSDMIQFSGNRLCALSADGRVDCRGANSYGASAVPDLLDPAIDLAVGSTHTCALSKFGQVSCWGYAPGNRTTPPQVERGFSAIAAAPEFTCGITADATLRCWGERAEYVEQAFAGTRSISKLWIGGSNVCAATSRKVLSCHTEGALSRYLSLWSEPVDDVAMGETAVCIVRAGGSAGTPRKARRRMPAPDYENAPTPPSSFP